MSAPYYADDLVTLYCGDWRESIDEDLYADLIVTDPPYGETSLGHMQDVPRAERKRRAA